MNDRIFDLASARVPGRDRGLRRNVVSAEIVTGFVGAVWLGVKVMLGK